MRVLVLAVLEVIQGTEVKARQGLMEHRQVQAPEAVEAAVEEAPMGAVEVVAGLAL